MIREVGSCVNSDVFLDDRAVVEFVAYAASPPG